MFNVNNSPIADGLLIKYSIKLNRSFIYFLFDVGNFDERAIIYSILKFLKYNSANLIKSSHVPFKAFFSIKILWLTAAVWYIFNFTFP